MTVTCGICGSSEHDAYEAACPAPVTADLSALLDRLEAAAAAATDGPWEADGLLVLPGYWGDTPPVLARTNDDADAALIVAAVNALPTLIAELRAHQAAVQAVRELFSGGPDTPCRTTWRGEGGLIGTALPPVVECVEVPLDDLRAAVAALDPNVPGEQP